MSDDITSGEAGALPTRLRSLVRLFSTCNRSNRVRRCCLSPRGGISGGGAAVSMSSISLLGPTRPGRLLLCDVDSDRPGRLLSKVWPA